MLKKLSINNFAIIDNIEIEFFSGMTVLTGTTGAGKSLIIDSINLLLGARADLDMIRFNENKAVIKGLFDCNDKIREKLNELGVSQDYLEIERTISKKGIIKINGTAVTLSELNKISKHLADVHSQEDTYKLINPDTYLSLIDSYSNIDLSNYLDLLFNYQEELKKYNQVINKNKTLNEKMDLLKFQFNEISSLDLKENELEELLVKEEKLKNFDKIYKNLNMSLQGLENEYFSIDNIYQASNLIHEIEDYDIEYKTYYERLNNAYFEIDDVLSNLKKTINNLDFEPEELEQIEFRINELKSLEKKYNKSIKEIIKYFEEIKYEIDLQENYEELLNQCKENVVRSYENVLKEAKKIQKIRLNSGLKIEEALIGECNDLDLQNVNFKIKFEEISLDPFKNSFLETGIDKVDFLISLNIGEPIKPLSKVASGGELSRIMLGLKDILAKYNMLSLMVFDEIDTGISGQTATKIAKKIKSISNYTQVLAITHQAQVASIADYQLNVTKNTINGRTTTNSKYLTFDERVKEIALMLNGTLSINALAGAKELLEK